MAAVLSLQTQDIYIILIKILMSAGGYKIID